MLKLASSVDYKSTYKYISNPLKIWSDSLPG